MLKEFKFLRIIKKPRTSVGMVKLKEEFNRDKYLIFIWSEYPEYPLDTNVTEFRGNILQFYNLTRGSSPTIYEIYKKESGYFDRSMVFGNRDRFPEFIRRKAKLKIIYTL
jgi:hypothetical protein